MISRTKWKKVRKMNDEMKVKLSIAAIFILGTICVMYGSLKVTDARHAEDAMQLAEGVMSEFGGLLLILLSLVVLIYVDLIIKMTKLRKEREDLLEKMENMKTSNRIFDGRTETMREDIIVLRDRIDYLEDKMYKESYPHDIEDEVF